MPRASYPTLLAIDRWAAIFGINPAHFAGGIGGTVMPSTGSCPTIWMQYAWQSGDRISREDLAEVIQQAEYDLARIVRYWPAPVWTCDEIHDYPRFFRREYYTTGLDVRGNLRSVQTNWGRVIAPGCRKVLTLCEAEIPPVSPPDPDLCGTIEYSDEDQDTYDETVTITMATTLTDACEIKVYFEGHCGEPEWEIRPARTKHITTGIFTATFWAWQFIDPALWEAFPTTTGVRAIDLDDGASYVTKVCIVRETNDVSCASAVFMWESLGVCSICGGTGCAACQPTYQDGCMRIRDAMLGLVSPMPGNYDQASADWRLANWLECREPDQVKLWYLSGDQDNKFLCGDGCEPLSNFWAETIAWVAAARLLKPVCDCINVSQRITDLQTDLAYAPSEGGGTYQMSTGDLDNPLGTRKGEVKAWRRISKLIAQRGKAAVV